MNLPFTAEQFFAVFAQYNQSIWPLQILFYVLAALMVFQLFKPKTWSGRAITYSLGLFWLWMGIGYHWSFFAAINPAARMFGAAFVLQGLLFFYVAFRKQMNFGWDKGWRSIVGMTLVVFGPVIYPLIGYFLGHSFPNSPTFGLPCPTTIFTFGFLLLAERPKKYLVIIPLLWSLLGFTAALKLGVTEDVSLLIAGVIATGWILASRKEQVVATA